MTAAILESFPVVSLGEVTQHRKVFDRIDDAASYKRCRVQLHAKGIVLRDELVGAAIKTKKQQVCRAGQLLVAEIDAKVGGYGIVPDDLDGAIVSSHYFLFDIDESKLNRAFLGYFVRTPHFFDQVGARGSTNYAAIRPAHVLAYQIPLPPLAEQRRIVAKIDALAAKIEEARSLREASLAELPLVWRSALGAIFRAEAANGKRIEDVCEAIVDNLHSTPRYDGDDYPCIRSQDVGWGTLDYKTALRTSRSEFTERTRRAEPRKGDIVFVREGDIGRCAVVDGSKRFSLGQRVMMLRSDPARVLPGFLMYQLMAPPVLDEQIRSAKTGTTSHHVNIKHLRNVRVVTPPLEEQRRIIAYLDDLQAKVDRLKALQAETAAELDALLPSILDRAFKGEL